MTDPRHESDTLEPEAEGDPQPESPQQEPTLDGPQADEADDPVEALRRQNEDLQERLHRAMADFQNAQRRHAKEKESAGTFAVSRFVKDLLPSLDNLKRALAVEATSEDAQAIAQGVQMVHDMLVNTLRAHGITPTGEPGEAFDPRFHEAMMQQPSDEPPMTILDVYETGWVLGEHTVRAAKVIVSSGPGKANA